MPDENIDIESAFEIEQAETALAEDNLPETVAPWKFAPAFRTLGSQRLGVLKGKIVAINVTLGDQDGAVLRRRTGLGRIEAYVRAIHGFIGGILPDTIPSPDAENPLPTISPDDRLRVFGAFGFPGGQLGSFDDTRRKTLAELAVAPKPGNFQPHWWPQAVVDAIAQELAVVETLDATADGTGQTQLYGERNAARTALAQWNDRVRAWVMHHSDLGGREPRLARYGHRVQTEDAESVAPPAAVGAATFDATARTLTATAGLPAGARSLRAYVEAAGGTPYLAGTSVTPVVNLAQLAPLLPGVQYRAWLVGYASDSGKEGAPSAVVEFAG